MQFFDLVNISEVFMELVNPSSPEKILLFGERLALQPDMRIIDFGCGFAEPLVLLAEAFGISGLGIDIRPYACRRAEEKIEARGLGDRLQIVCGDASEIPIESQRYDAAICLGATFIWGGFEPALQAMQAAIKAGGKLGIGEVYWRTDEVPVRFGQRKEDILPEIDLYRLARKQGFAIAGIVRADSDDWDRYESDNWKGLLHWLAENPDHPDREDVARHLKNSQEEYLAFGRQHLGWAMYALEKQSL